MEVFGILFFIMFFAVFALVFVQAARGVLQWNKNNHAPRLTVDATVVAKRTNVTRHRSKNHMSHTSTTYFVTFQVESGDRMELMLPGNEFGLMVEGDRGKVSFQGTRFLGFERR